MSQREGVNKAIDGHNFTMYMLAPRQSNALLVKVSKMIGPSAGPIIDQIMVLTKGRPISESLDQEVDVSDFFTKASGVLFSSLDQLVIDNVIDEFAKVTEADDVFVNRIFDDFFRGKLDLMYKWLAWGMSVQWGKSLSALVGALRNQGEEVKT